MRRQTITAIFSATGFLLLILDAKTALLSASEGITLCLYTVVPALLPFFFLSMMLTASLMGRTLPLLRPIGTICKMPEGSESILLSGLLGGYPSGAQTIAQCWQSGYLQRDSASRMLGFCNLAGPSFLFGIVAQQFSSARSALLLWLIQILSAIATAMVLPEKPQAKVDASLEKTTSPTQILQSSIRIMALICGWVVLFRVILGFLRRWFLWMLPIPLQVMLCGILELSNGCCELVRISSEGLRFVLASGMLAFGGVCVTMQTASAAHGLDLSGYIPAKLLQTILCLIFALILQKFLFSSSEQMSITPVFVPLLLTLLVISAVILQKTENNSRISQPIGV